MTEAHDWSAWVGKQEEVVEIIAADRVADLAATLDRDPPGKALPAGWHWIFFSRFVRRSGVGADGHPMRGGFLPPVPLPRRMWAGGRLHYAEALPIGALAKRVSTIAKVEAKSGKRGQLVFVTVEHVVSVDSRVCIEEQQDIVYREPAALGASGPAPDAAPPSSDSAVFTPDPVLLFRFSALTGNGHRIHYDRPYATEEEGYRDLVVHGPLLAILLQGLATEVLGRMPTAFTFRGIAPVFVDRPFRLERGDRGEDLPLWVRGADGETAMRATAH